jgi:hypothetical protein
MTQQMQQTKTSGKVKAVSVADYIVERLKAARSCAGERKPIRQDHDGGALSAPHVHRLLIAAFGRSSRNGVQLDSTTINSNRMQITTNVCELSSALPMI